MGHMLVATNHLRDKDPPSECSRYARVERDAAATDYRFDRETLTLNELDDVAVLEIDRWDKHVEVESHSSRPDRHSRTEMPFAFRCRFNSLTLDSA